MVYFNPANCTTPIAITNPSGRVYSCNRPTSLCQYQRCFDCGLFESYHEQFLSFVDGKLNEDPKLWEKLSQDNLTDYQLKFFNFIQLVRKGFGERYQERYQFHKNIVDDLRRLIIHELGQRGVPNREPEDGLSAKCRQFIGKLCIWMYLEVDLDKALYEFTVKYALNSNALNFQDQGKLLLDIQRNVKEIQEFNDVCRLPEYSDGHRLGQLACKVFTHSSSGAQIIYSANVIVDYSHFNPTTNSYQERIEINPEFLTYLLVLKAEQQTHLQVVLMSRRRRDEMLLTNEFEKLEKNNPWTKDSLFVIMLDKNSDFYWQQDGFDYESLPFIEFKILFMNCLFEEPDYSYFYWPSKLDLDEWREKCLEIIDGVNGEYFLNHETLSVNDRKVFIDLVYVKIIEKLCEELKFKSVGVNCRHSVDRTPALLTLLSLNEIFRSKSDLDEEETKKMAALTFAPAMIYHNRTPSEFYLERTALTVSYMQRRFAAQS